MYAPIAQTAASFDWNGFLAQLIAAAAGAFLGAGAAFGLERWQRIRGEDERNVAAGNLALLILTLMYSDYLNMRKGIRNLIEEAKTKANCPPWFELMPPMHYNFAREARFDFSELAFLAQIGDVKVFEKLLLVEKRHAHLVHLSSEHERIGSLAQLRMEGAGMPESGLIHHADLKTVLGPNLIGLFTSVRAGFDEVFKKDEDDYVAASVGLHDELARLYVAKRRFRKRYKILRPVKKDGFG